MLKVENTMVVKSRSAVLQRMHKQEWLMQSVLKNLVPAMPLIVPTPAPLEPGLQSRAQTMRDSMQGVVLHQKNRER
jgi:hypothetical protein